MCVSPKLEVCPAVSGTERKSEERLARTPGCGLSGATLDRACARFASRRRLARTRHEPGAVGLIGALSTLRAFLRNIGLHAGSCLRQVCGCPLTHPFRRLRMLRRTAVIGRGPQTGASLVFRGRSCPADLQCPPGCPGGGARGGAAAGVARRLPHHLHAVLSLVRADRPRPRRAILAEPWDEALQGRGPALLPHPLKSVDAAVHAAVVRWPLARSPMRDAEPQSHAAAQRPLHLPSRIPSILPGRESTRSDQDRPPTWESPCGA